MSSEPIWLTPTTPVAQISACLAELGVLETPKETVQGVAIAGQGNMNCVLRVTTSRRSLIVKQARPWVEKYPQIAAPVERAWFEARFYQAIEACPVVARQMPKRLASDPSRYLLVLEDLGAGHDAAAWYREPLTVAATRDICAVLVQWLAALHDQVAPDTATGDLHNRSLRELNHAHLFEIPFAQPPVVDLDAITPGLRSLSAEVSGDRSVRQRAVDMGKRYLSEGPCLVHGDFFPGSWLLTSRGLFVIDPEFCHLGHAEFDLAVMAAHLELAGRPLPLDDLLADYTAHRPSARLHRAWIDDWMALEILRRLLGVAQLPLSCPLAEKRQLILRACRTLNR